MFEFLAPFRKVLVTGPQRSGTRICAEMIYRDLDRPPEWPVLYVDEANLNVENLSALCDLVLRDARRLVVQCPALSRYVHHFGAREDVAVVWMVRPLVDIVASQRRIGWTAGDAELLRYDEPALAFAFTPDSPSAARVKNEYWQRVQRARILNTYEVEYESLSAHPLWVPADERRGFAPWQTQKEKGEHYRRKAARLREAQDSQQAQVIRTT